MVQDLQYVSIFLAGEHIPVLVKCDIAHDIVDEPATPPAHVTRRVPLLRPITGIINHLVAKYPDVLEHSSLHLLQSRRGQSFGGDPPFECMFFMIDSRHDHLSLEEMAEHGEELAFLAVGTHVIDVTQGGIRVHGDAMWAVPHNWTCSSSERWNMETMEFMHRICSATCRSRYVCLQ